MGPDCVDVDDSAELAVRCQENPGVAVKLVDRYVPEPTGVGFGVIALADGLTARVDGEVWVWQDDLAHFLQGLADDFRGWDGERVWRAHHLELRARFHSRGHVSLTWTLWATTTSDTWQASITTWLEAGAQMATLAADVHRFLRPTEV